MGGKARRSSAAKTKSRKKHTSASVIETSDDEEYNSEDGLSVASDDVPRPVTFPHLPSPKPDESKYWKEKRKNMERNAALMKELDIKNSADALFNSAKQPGTDKQTGQSDVSLGYVLLQNVVVFTFWQAHPSGKAQKHDGTREGSVPGLHGKVRGYYCGWRMNIADGDCQEQELAPPGSPVSDESMSRIPVMIPNSYVMGGRNGCGNMLGSLRLSWSLQNSKAWSKS